MKAQNPEDVKKFEDIPNVGTSTAGDFRELGINDPYQLVSCNAYDLYNELCDKTGKRHDPCVIDVFLSAIYFMNGKGTKPWWYFTKERKDKLKV